MARLISGLIAAFSLCVCTPGLAQDLRHIEVVGDGEVALAPDMARISIRVTAQAETAGEAMAQMSTSARELLDMLLTVEQIDSNDVQTGQLSLHPRYADYSRSGGDEPQIIGFTAETTVDLRVRDLTRLGGLLDAAVSEGANGLNGLTFDVQDRSTAMDEARRAAVADARANAELYADAAGVRLGQVVSLQEHSQAQGGPQPMMMSALERGAVPVAAGELTLNVSVSMVYEIAANVATGAE